MVDRVKFTLPAGLLDTCECLTFQHTVEDTGEQGEWKTAQYNDFEIRVNNRTGWNEVKGSLHKQWSGTHNGGAFPRWAVGQAVDDLASALGFDPSQAVLHGLEFGANVPMPTPAKDLLRRAILSSKKGGRPKPLNTKYSEQGLMREVVAQQYFGKLYDKEEQLTAAGYSAPGTHLMRVEVKVRKMQLLDKAGVRTLADLTKPAALATMGELLSEHLNSILFAVPGELPPTLRTSQRKLLRDGATVGYWEGLAKQPQLRVQVKRYRELTAQHVSDVALDAATQGLRSVWQQLLNEPVPSLAAGVVPEATSTQINPLSRGISKAQEEEKATALPRRAEGLLVALPNHPHPLDEGEPAPRQPARRCCQSCGQELDPGRQASTKYCGKKCRNAASNPAHNARRALLKIESQPLLFSIREFVRVPEQYRAFVLAAA